jgi:hypothetical protein
MKPISPMDAPDDPRMDLLHSIEAGLVGEYGQHPELTDSLCIFGLENAKVAVKQAFGFGRNESCSRTPATTGIIDGCVALAKEAIAADPSLTVKEFNSKLDKVIRSVRRHSQDGRRSYYEFVRGFA